MSELFNNAHALFIGVGTYTSENITTLEESVNDATDLRDVFIDPLKAAYDPNNVQLITNEEATKAGIIGAFDNLISSTDENSTVVVYYSGHGAVTQSGETFLLVPHNYDPSDHTTWFMDDQFQEKIAAVKAKKMIVLLDACHSGGMSKDINNTDENKLGVSKSIRGLASKLGEGSGRAIISSCTDNELSWIVGKNSIFTQALLEALEGKHPHDEDDRYVNLLQVIDYVFKQVPKKSVNAGANRDPKQHPFVNRIENMADGFPLCFLPEGKSKSMGSKHAGKDNSLLVQEKEGLERNASLLLRKISFMQMQQNILSDPAQQFQIQEQLLDLTNRKAEFSRKIDELNALING